VMLRKANVIIIGAGDKGTSIALRMYRSGFRPVLIERNNPTDLHSFRNYSDTVYLGRKQIDDIECLLTHLGADNADRFTEIEQVKSDRKLPILRQDQFEALNALDPDIIIDCRGKIHSEQQFEWEQYPCVIRIGNQYRVGSDGHFIIGDSDTALGRVLVAESQESMERRSEDYISCSPLEGIFIAEADVGSRITEKETVGTINDIKIMAPRNGLLTGMLHSGHFVAVRQPLFEIYPERLADRNRKVIPNTCWAIAGGVLEAALTFITENEKLFAGR